MNSLWLRSRLFWIGLIGLVFLIVVWGSHEKSVLGGTYTNAAATTTYSFGWGNGTLRFGWLDHKNTDESGNPREPGLKMSRRPVPEEVSTSNFAPVYQSDAQGIMHFIGIWVLVAAYTVIWYGSLLWLRP